MPPWPSLFQSTRPFEPALPLAHRTHPHDWVGFDLDGTLAQWDPAHPLQIGPPVPAMVARVHAYLEAGIPVKIVTARVAASGQCNGEGTHDGEAFAREQRGLIEAWCRMYLGRVLPITAQKDFRMLRLYDDRCVSVVHNTGQLVHPAGRGLVG